MFVCVRFYMLLLVCVRLWETVALGGLSCCCQATRCSKPQTRSDHSIVVSCNLISLFGARDRQSSDFTSTFTLCLHFCIFAWPDSRRFFSTWTCTLSLNLPGLVVVWIKIGRKDSFGLRPFVQKAHCTQLHTKCYISRRLDHSPPNSRSAFKLWTFLLFNWLLLYIDLSWTDLLCIALYPLYAVPQLHIALYPAYAVPYGSNRPNLLPRSHYHRPYHQ